MILASFKSTNTKCIISQEVLLGVRMARPVYFITEVSCVSRVRARLSNSKAE